TGEQRARQGRGAREDDGRLLARLSRAPWRVEERVARREEEAWQQPPREEAGGARRREEQEVAGRRGWRRGDGRGRLLHAPLRLIPGAALPRSPRRLGELERPLGQGDHAAPTGVSHVVRFARSRRELRGCPR